MTRALVALSAFLALIVAAAIPHARHLGLGLWKHAAEFASSKSGTLVFDLLGTVGLLSVFFTVYRTMKQLRRSIPVPIQHRHFRIGTWEPSEKLLVKDWFRVDAKTGLIVGIGAERLLTVESKRPAFDLPRLKGENPEMVRLANEMVQYYRQRPTVPLDAPQVTDRFPFDSTIARLDSVEILEPHSMNQTVLLRISPIQYYDFLVTNLSWESRFLSLDDKPESKRSLRLLEPSLRARYREMTQHWAGEFSSVEDVLNSPYLGNGITIHMNVIDARDQLLVGYRPSHMSIYPESFISSVSGAVDWKSHRVSDDVAPSPFVTAVKRGLREVGLDLAIHQMVFFGVVMQQNQYHPILVGEVILGEEFSEARMQTRGMEDESQNAKFLKLPLNNLKLCAAALRHKRWIPASAAAVSMSLLARHKIEDLSNAFHSTRKPKSERRVQLWMDSEKEHVQEETGTTAWVLDDRWSRLASTRNALRLSQWDPYGPWKNDKQLRCVEDGQCGAPKSGGWDEDRRQWLKRIVEWQGEHLLDGDILGVKAVRVSQDEPAAVSLVVRRTSYFNFLANQVAHSSAFAPHWRLAGVPTTRDSSIPFDPGLPNGLAIHVFLVDSGRNVWISKRPATSILYAQHFSATVAGMVDAADLRHYNIASAAKIAARREMTEELGSELTQRVWSDSDIRWMTIATERDHQHPILLGVIHSSLTVEEISTFLSTDANEVASMSRINLSDRKSIIRSLTNDDWIPVSAAGLHVLMTSIIE